MHARCRTLRRPRSSTGFLDADAGRCIPVLCSGIHLNISMSSSFVLCGPVTGRPWQEQHRTRPTLLKHLWTLCCLVQRSRRRSPGLVRASGSCSRNRTRRPTSRLGLKSKARAAAAAAAAAATGARASEEARSRGAYWPQSAQGATRIDELVLRGARIKAQPRVLHAVLPSQDFNGVLSEGVVTRLVRRKRHFWWKVFHRLMETARTWPGRALVS